MGQAIVFTYAIYLVEVADGFINEFYIAFDYFCNGSIGVIICFEIQMALNWQLMV